MSFGSRFVLLFAAVVLTFGVMVSATGAAPQGPKTLAPEKSFRNSNFHAAPAAGCETIQYDNAAAGVLSFRIPDQYDDTLNYVRVTPAFACTLKTVSVYLDDLASHIGTPGIRVSIYSVAGGFPDTAITYVDVPNAALADFGSPTIADFSSLNLVLNGDFAVVFQRIGAASDTLRVLIDDGSSLSGRSGEYYAPGDVWEPLSLYWGADYAFVIRTDMCCGDPPACTPGAPQTDWPSGGNFQRTFRSNAAVGDECQLTLDWVFQGDSLPAGSNQASYTNVVVQDTLGFLSFANYLACVNLKTGDTIWNFRENGSLLMGDDLRCNVTVDDSLVYVGGGSFRAFSCVRVADGSVKWSRNFNTTPLGLGYTRYAPSVVVDSLLFFTDEQQSPGGNLWAVNKYTGVNTPAWSTNPFVFSEGWVLNALTWTGDSLLLAGTASQVSATGEPDYQLNGRLYAIRVADGTQKWELEDPSAKYLDPDLANEGFTGSLAYENGILYYQSNILNGPNYDHYPWDGSAGAIDVNAEDGSGAGILWVCTSPIGRAFYGGPVIGEGVVYYNCDGVFVGAANPKGVTAVNKDNGALLWNNPLEGAGVASPLTITCEASGTPYIFAGSRAGYWYLLDGFSGDVIWSRIFSGRVHGTAVVDSQVLVSTRNSLAGNGNGMLASFRVSGVNRPRMDLLQVAPFATNALPGSGNTTVDTIYNALTNVGCADLILNSFGVDTLALAARVTAVDPQLATKAANLANRMASAYMAFADGFMYPTGPGLLEQKYGLFRRDLVDDNAGLAESVRHWTNASLADAAVPQVVTVETPAPATVLNGDSLSIAIRIDETGQVPRTTVRNYITLNHNDPDFFPEDPTGTEFGDPVIAVDAIFGYAFEEDTLRALDAMTQVTNHGAYGVGDDNIFYVEGDNTASMFDGGVFITGKLADTPRTAWDVYDWLEFQPDTFLTIYRDTVIGTVDGLTDQTGTIAHSTYIDSIGFPDSATTYAYGVEVRETQVSINLTGADIGSWKVFRHQIVNRNATPVDSVIYIGNFCDWDIESGNNNIDTTMMGPWSNVYMYDPGSSISAYGVLKLPAPGTMYEEPDGTMKTATGFYSVYGVTNPLEVYPSGAAEPLSDSIYSYVSRPGVNTATSLTQNDDMSLAVVFDTLHLAANDTVWVYYALWGTASGGDLNSAARDAAFGSNLVSGFRRGDVNADGDYNFLDLVYLYRFITSGGTGYHPIPRDLTGDVNNDGVVNMTDVLYLEDYIYGGGPSPIGAWWF